MLDHTFNLIKFLRDHLDTSSFSFDRQEDEDALGFLDRRSFYGMDLVKNVHTFFQETNLQRFNVSDRRSLDDSPEVRKVFSRVNDPEFPWTCHIAAPYIAINSQRWSSHVFGFVSQDISENKKGVHTMPHSFNSDGNNEFVDPKCESSCIYEEYWVQKYGKSRGFDNPRFTMSDFHSYIGVRIPKNVTRDIFGDNPNRQGNFWGYVKYNIFYDYWKTMWFIDVVNNSGEGWVYDPPSPRR